MLKSTLLFVAIVSDMSANVNLTQGEVVRAASIVAQEPEFNANREIAVLVSDLRQSDKCLNKLRKYAHDNSLKDLF